MKIVNEIALEEAKLPRKIDKVVASVLFIVGFLYLTTLFNVVRTFSSNKIRINRSPAF